MSDHGYETELLVQDICRTVFLADFTVPGPKFSKGSGLQKEAADILIPFGDILIAVQVKSRGGDPPKTHNDPVYLGRIEKRVIKGLEQLKTIKRAITAGKIKEFRNRAGIILPFSPEALRKLIGLVILDIPNERSLPKDQRTSILNGFQVRHGILAHIFLLDDFKEIALEVDTLPDFLEYLEVREHYIGGGRVLSHTSELDLLATYKTQPELRSPQKRPDGLVLLDGLWDSYIKSHSDKRSDRRLMNRPSYLIDRAIEWLHTCIGYEHPFVIPNLIPIPTKSPNHVKYAKIALELSRLNRLERRMIGEKWVEKMELAEKVGHGHALVLFPNQFGFFLMASDKKDRAVRACGLYNLACMAYCHGNLRKLIAVATETIKAKKRSYDWIYLEDVSFENELELKQMATKAFGPGEHVTGYEFSPTEIKSIRG